MNRPLRSCEDNCIGETARRIQERIKDHNGIDHKLHMLKHSIEKYHDNMTQDNFKIIAKNFRNNKWKQKNIRTTLDKGQTKNIRTTLDKGLMPDPQHPTNPFH